ncbi:hypothetical protein [Streptococcus suis]|uniref:hypothetical protein n=1 Tax=Streptococcus suis TaxID=1307 RepID=UPI000C178F48|nr:hypothetical protein [Streptococcus suis]
MVSRKKYITKQLKKYKLDFKFYSEFCDILNIYNDLENYFQIKVNDIEATSLILDIAYTIIKNVDIDSLLHMYPIYLKEHIHFNIFSQKFYFFKSSFSRYIQNDIIQKNEWEEKYLEYCARQIKFFKDESEYYLDNRELNDISIEHNLSDSDKSYPDRIDIERYFELYSKKITAKHIFHNLFLLIKGEVLNGL